MVGSKQEFKHGVGGSRFQINRTERAHCTLPMCNPMRVQFHLCNVLAVYHFVLVTGLDLWSVISPLEGKSFAVTPLAVRSEVNPRDRHWWRSLISVPSWGSLKET